MRERVRGEGGGLSRKSKKGSPSAVVGCRGGHDPSL